jgi:hypothetical protein
MSSAISSKRHSKRQGVQIAGSHGLKLAGAEKFWVSHPRDSASRFDGYLQSTSITTMKPHLTSTQLEKSS